MIRKQVYLTPAEDGFLKARAIAQGVSEADVVREAIDALEADLADRKRRHEAWLELDAAIEERMQLEVPQDDSYRWSRDEIYEERMARNRVAEPRDEYEAAGRGD